MLTTLLLTPMLFFAAEETVPKAETILDRYVEATGGKAAFEKHRNEVMHATVEIVARADCSNGIRLY